MKPYLLILPFILGLTALIGCQENDMDTYQNDPAIYFEHDQYGQQDSINFSFFLSDRDAVRDTVHLIVRAMGMPADYDRPISLVQTNTGNPDAAVPGKHFMAFDNPEIKDSICIPAGKIRASIPVIILRDPSLDLETVRLELSVGTNEFFRPGIDELRNFLVTMTSQATKPTNWDKWKRVFGPTWGTEKMRFIIDHTGYTDFENMPTDYNYQTWLGTTVKQALLEYNAAHPNDPLAEADGTLVTFE